MKRIHLVRTLNKKTQVVRYCYAFYDMIDGGIELGCEEKYVAQAIWHESIHKLLFEDFFLEANYMWDNIADDISEFLFNSEMPEKPYVCTLPAFKAKSEDGGVWISGKRKQREKSIRVGWKPDTTKRVPIRKHDTIKICISHFIYVSI